VPNDEDRQRATATCPRPPSPHTIDAVSGEPAETGRAMGDEESQEWVERLRPAHARHGETVGKLRAILLGVAFHELSRRRGQLGSIAGPEYDDLAHQVATMP
jgi:hypothetical protein